MECVTAGDWDRGETAWRETRVIRKNKTRGTRQSGIKTGGPVWKLHSCHASDMLLVGPPGLFLVQGDEMTSHVFVLGYKRFELLEWKLAPFVFCLPALTTAEIWLRFHFTLWFGINRKKIFKCLAVIHWYYDVISTVFKGSHGQPVNWCWWSSPLALRL